MVVLVPRGDDNLGDGNVIRCARRKRRRRGTTITADAAVDLEALAAGDEVTITVDDTTTSATSVEQNDGM